MKKKVKFLQSIAGLADPDIPKLDLKYQRLRELMSGQRTMGGRRIPEDAIAKQIAEEKRRDRYDAQPIGFKQDWSFRPDQEATIEADLAQKWEEAGYCAIVQEKPTKAA
jgi:hypothetical protein